VTLRKHDMTQTDSMRSMSQGEWYPVCLNCREVAGRSVPDSTPNDDVTHGPPARRVGSRGGQCG
jgi:hypothetical protein